MVAPGANAELKEFELPPSDAVLAQLEIPDEAVRRAWEQSTGLFCLNAAPARPIDVDADLTVVNRYELEVLRRRGRPRRASRSAPRGRSCSRTGRRSPAPSRRRWTRSTAPRPATRSPPACSSRCSRAASREEALRRSCAAGALAASRFGAQPSLPTAAEIDAILRAVTTPVILDCDPGHDDAIALLLALASPEIELVGVTTDARQPDAREDDGQRAPRARARRPRPTCRSPPARTGRSCASSTSPPTSTARAASTAPSCRRAPPSRSSSTPSTSSSST